MIALVHIDDGIIENVLLYTDDMVPEAKEKQAELAKQCESDPRAKWVAMYKVHINNGKEAEWLSSLPEDYPEEDK